MATNASLAFGQLLRRYRRDAHLTQEVLAERAGISARTVSDLERGLYQRPHWDTVQLLADALQLDPDERRLLEAAGGRGPGEPSRPSEDGVPDEGRPSGGRSDAPSGQRPGLATGIQTFLMTDIRSYTRFTQERGDEAAAQLTAQFAELVEDVVSPRDGRVIETRGDEVLVAFASARGALQAAVALQARLRSIRAREPSLPLHAGVGLDAGEAVPVSGGYRGAALNLAARLCALAAGGEVFASEGVVHLAQRTEGLAFVDRGEVQLKGLPTPVRVIQIVPEDESPDEVRPLQSILVTHPTNLPDEPTPFIGREHEVDGLTALLTQPAVRLVTLTGTGGTGKTRLALQAGSALLAAFRDGVFFVSLASLTDPTLVPLAIAGVLGVQEAETVDPLAVVTGFLEDKHLLLVLDNYEHLLPAAGVVATLLDRCRELHILVTSRMPLHLLREHEYPVLPLAVPAASEHLDPQQLSQYDAVALFIDRARAVRPDFHVTDDNAPAVAELCCRLDGLPLAIELAAARIRLFPPKALLQRLSQRLSLLTDRTRDRVGRHQTLRAAIDWSYSLLSEDDRMLFARLSVFAGSGTLEAVAAVCDPEGELDLVAGISTLVEISLLRQEGEDEPRFGMLETIREYAGEKLAERGEEAKVRAAHATYFTQLAEEAEPELAGAEEAVWLTRLEEQHDNLRAALGWSLQTGSELGLRTAGALYRFWLDHGHWIEGRRWLEAVLAAGDEAECSATARAKVLYAAGDLAAMQDDSDRAAELLEESLRLGQKVGDTWTVVASLGRLGAVAANKGDWERAQELFSESLPLARHLGDPALVARGVLRLGYVAEHRGDLECAQEFFEEGLELHQRLGDRAGMAEVLCRLALLAAYREDWERSTTLFQEALRLAQELGDTAGIAVAILNLGAAEALRGQYERAKGLFEESVRLHQQLGDQMFIGSGRAWLGYVAAREGDVKRAVELCTEGLRMFYAARIRTGMAHTLIHLALVSGFEQEYEQAAERLGAAGDVAEGPFAQLTIREVSQAALAALEADRYEAAWRRGQEIGLESAVARALGEGW